MFQVYRQNVKRLRSSCVGLGCAIFRMKNTWRMHFCSDSIHRVCTHLLGPSLTTAVLNMSGNCSKFKIHFGFLAHAVDTINSNAYNQGATAVLHNTAHPLSGSLAMYWDGLLNLSVFPPFEIKWTTRTIREPQGQ